MNLARIYGRQRRQRSRRQPCRHCRDRVQWRIYAAAVADLLHPLTLMEASHQLLTPMYLLPQCWLEGAAVGAASRRIAVTRQLLPMSVLMSQLDSSHRNPNFYCDWNGGSGRGFTVTNTDDSFQSDAATLFLPSIVLRFFFFLLFNCSFRVDRCTYFAVRNM